MAFIRKFCAVFSALLLVLVSSCGRSEYLEQSTTATTNPHEGMIEVSDGAGGIMWAPLLRGVDVNGHETGQFTREGGFVLYSGEAYTARRGIDISFYQGEINWEEVRADGIEFAILRAGYRGYSEGQLFEDEKFREYAEGALAVGIEIGAYFFSQAVSVEEAREEARLTLSVIEDYDISLPVAYDWETIGYEAARTDGVDGKTVTDCALAFCAVVREAGYEPGVYLYRSLGYYSYDLTRFSGLSLWVGAAGDYPDFYYAHEIWQFSFTGKVRGIKGDVDLNLQFIPK